MAAQAGEVENYLNGIIYKLYARARTTEPVADSPGNMSIIDDPADVDRILKAPAQFQKNYSLLSLLGGSRFSANGPEWEHRRSLTQPQYLQAANPRNRSAIRSVYEQQLSRCSSLAPSDIQEALLAAAITVFFGALHCSVDSGALLRFFARVRPVLKMAQYLSWVGADSIERSKLAAQAGNLLQDYRAAVNDTPDLVELMNRFRAEATSVAAFEPHEELLMNFFAGIETSAATLAWTITCLAPDPRIQERVYQEAIGESEETPYLECFINETMRYFPAIPFVVREVVEATTLGNRNLQPDSLVLVSVVGVHHHPGYWKEPHLLDTSRSEFLDNSYDRRAFLPFLTGPRMCGGARLARLEITEGLKSFLRMYSVSGGTDQFTFDYGLAMRPDSWSHIKISRRPEAPPPLH